MKRFLPHYSINLNNIILILSLLLFSAAGHAQERKLQNRPYIDERIWHWGFMVGLNVQDLALSNSGLPAVVNGVPEYWYADVDSYSPGFSVGLLGEIKLNDYLAARLLPTIHFGDKMVMFREQAGLESRQQVIKSSYLSLPLDLKLSGERCNNWRPYVMAGIAPSLDLTVRTRQELLVRKLDCMLEVGFGMDYYYDFFKLIPELKFCFGLRDIIEKNRKDIDDASIIKYSNAVDGARSRMIVLSLYFE